jgi:crossover junction endodeoxyribonuclease RuvC
MSCARWSRRYFLRRREKRDKALVLGIDPGSRSMGYGLVERDGPDYRYVASGRIVPGPKNPLHLRLRELYEDLNDVIREYGPSEAVVEKVFFAKSAQSALSLGQARGITLLAAASSGLMVHEYSALAVKKAVTGYGRAEKAQVQEMVKSLLDIRVNLSSDGADALALVLCHINTTAFNKAVGAR